jgi:hypothetical protein
LTALAGLCHPAAQLGDGVGPSEEKIARLVDPTGIDELLDVLVVLDEVDPRYAAALAFLHHVEEFIECFLVSVESESFIQSNSMQS